MNKYIKTYDQITGKILKTVDVIGETETSSTRENI